MLQFFFVFGGRISRSAYWLRFCLPLLAIFLIVGMALPPLHFNEGVLVLMALVLWPWIAVSTKRYHDRNRCGWFLLIVLVPFFGPLWLFIELGFLRGTVGPNRFGPDPLARA